MAISHCSLLAALICLTKQLKERMALQREENSSTSNTQTVNFWRIFTDTFLKSFFPALIYVIKEWGNAKMWKRENKAPLCSLPQATLVNEKRQHRLNQNMTILRHGSP